jgi:3-oxoacid CoA-transferase subunit A
VNKIFPTASEAIADIQDGAVLLVGGFGLCGNPENLIAAVHAKGTKDLTLVSNNCGTTELGLGVLLKARPVRKSVASYVGENKEFERQYLSGELEVDLVPQGTLAERCRAGAAGIGGFYTRTGVGTQVADGKETRRIAGHDYVLESPIKGDFALIKAHLADTFGNLVFRKTARNFNACMAGAARVTIAEVEEIVPAGTIDPDHVHVPSIYVQRLVLGKDYRKPIERRTTRPRT